MITFLSTIDWFGVSGLLIALGALVQSRKALQHAEDQMQENQKHMKLSVRPLLTGHYILLTNKELAVEVENRGIGPAIIKRWDLWFDGDIEDKLPIESSAHLIPFISSKLSDPSLPFVCTSKKRGTILQPDAHWRVFELDADVIGSAAKFEQLKAEVQRITIRIEYQSLYDEDFVETVSRFRIE